MQATQHSTGLTVTGRVWKKLNAPDFAKTVTLFSDAGVQLAQAPINVQSGEFTVATNGVASRLACLQLAVSRKVRTTSSYRGPWSFARSDSASAAGGSGGGAQGHRQSCQRRQTVPAARNAASKHAVWKAAMNPGLRAGVDPARWHRQVISHDPPPKKDSVRRRPDKRACKSRNVIFRLQMSPTPCRCWFAPGAMTRRLNPRVVRRRQVTLTPSIVRSLGPPPSITTTRASVLPSRCCRSGRLPTGPPVSFAKGMMSLFGSL